MAADLDPDLLKLFSFQLFTKLEGAVTAAMVHLGDQLGLYRILRDAVAPRSSADLAAAAGLDERWVREWAYNQAAARMIVAEPGDGGAGDERFSLTPEAAAVLADPDHPAYGMGMFHRLPQTMRAVEEMPESFRTGRGHDYDSHGPQGAVGIERSFEPWNKAFLLPVVLPALDGVVARLQEGARVADVGCGAGSAVLLMAQAYPASTFTGYDISHYALGRAEEKRAAANVVNAAFHDPRQEALPSNHTLDLVTTFDCIHDMTHPQEALEAIHENAAKNPMASLMYGISVLSCMSSALSEPGGAGLGTLGLSEERARRMAEAAGFTRFRRLSIDHSVNAFYEVRP